MQSVQHAVVASLAIVFCSLCPATAQVPEDANPFRLRVPAPEFPDGMQWLNTEKPLKLAELRGKFVLLDFWTYCCINCMHVLPELKKLEQEFDEQLVVIGVHSAKFETEQETKNIGAAILRYEIVHPVVNDNQHVIWNNFRVRSWPTTMLIDPEGNIVFGKSGEFEAKEYSDVLKIAIPFYQKNGSLKASKNNFELLADKQEQTPLRFPAKLLADAASNRLFISDSNHNRIVVADLDGKLQAVVGSGDIGSESGSFETSSFNHPQGMALRGNKLYVADTENHLIREIDFASKQVRRVAGTGKQSRNAFQGSNPLKLPPRPWLSKPSRTPIASPWDLWWHDGELYIAMAGTHQIWRWNPIKDRIGPYAGNAREDIVDGPLLPAQPYMEGSSSFAQPSGLTSDGKSLFVADSEGSSIRAVPLADGNVRTVVGTADLPQNRLFTFGDVDGNLSQAKLQHALGVCFADSKLFVADTYNNKIKVIDLKAKAIQTLAGDGLAGNTDSPARFDEPSGLDYAQGKLYVADTNNHSIRVIDLATKIVSTLQFEGLTPPRR